MQTSTTTGRSFADATSGVAVEVPEGAPSLRPRTSWGAILVGALLAVAVGATLNILGLAVGATAVDTTARGTPSMTTFGLGAGIWLLLSNLIGLAVGGYVAARLCGTADRTDASLHGLGVWATAFLISALVLGNVLAGTTRTAFDAVSGIIGGAAQGAGQAASAVTGQINPETMVERARLALTGPSEPARMTTEQRTAEISGLIATRISNGSLTSDQRNRLNALVAAEAGIPEQEAAQRVQAYEANAQRTASEAEERARRAADAAAAGTAAAAFWVFAALVLGAVASTLGARFGTRNILAIPANQYGAD